MTPDEELQILLMEFAEIEEAITENQAELEKVRAKIRASLPAESDTLTEVAHAIIAKEKQLTMLAARMAVRGDADDDRRIDLAATWIRITDAEVRQLHKKDRHAAYMLSLKRADELSGYSQLQRVRAGAR